MAKKKLAQAADYAAVTFDADLSNEQMEHLEREEQHPDHGTARRIGLSVLTRSKKQILEKLDTDTVVALLKGSAAIDAYCEHLRAVDSLMTTARVRLQVVMESAIQANPELGSIEVEEAEA